MPPDYETDAMETLFLPAGVIAGLWVLAVASLVWYVVG